MPASIKVKANEIYKMFPNKSGFISYPLVMSDGSKIAGIYKGFGKTLFVRNEPTNRKGFSTLNPVDTDYDGAIKVFD